MKMKPAHHFMDKGYYSQKVHFKEDTELMISNQQYNSSIQFQWSYIKDKIA